jgi:hypothetical protein
MYLYELVNWLTTVVDSLALKDTYKDEAYKEAVGYIAECLMVSIPLLVGHPADAEVNRGMAEFHGWPECTDDERERSCQYSHRHNVLGE